MIRPKPSILARVITACACGGALGGGCLVSPTVGGEVAGAMALMAILSRPVAYFLRDDYPILPGGFAMVATFGLGWLLDVHAELFAIYGYFGIVWIVWDFYISALPKAQCWKCGSGYEKTAKFCDKCGASQEETSCPKCGSRNRIDASFCQGCGMTAMKR